MSEISDLANEIAKILVERKQTIAVAESDDRCRRVIGFGSNKRGIACRARRVRPFSRWRRRLYMGDSMKREL